MNYQVFMRVTFMFRKIKILLCLLAISAVSFAFAEELSPLRVAVRTGNELRVRELLKQGQETKEILPQIKTTLLMDAANFPKIIQLLLKKDTSNINAQDNEDWTALMYASGTGKVKSVELLLQNGADPNIVDSKGRSPLSWASSNGNIEAMKSLLDAGAV